MKGNSNINVGGILKGAKGMNVKANARPDNNKMKAIFLYGWEGAPYVKPVREALDELSLAHVMVNCAPGSTNRYVLNS